MSPKTCLHDSSARMGPAHQLLSPPEALVHVVPVLFAGPLAVPLGHTRQVSLCSPGVLCRCLPGAVLQNSSFLSFAPHPPSAQSTLPNPAHEDRSFLCSSFLVQGSPDYFMTANGTGRNRAATHPNANSYSIETIKKYIHSHRNTTQLYTLNRESIKPDSFS